MLLCLQTDIALVSHHALQKVTSSADVRRPSVIIFSKWLILYFNNILSVVAYVRSVRVWGDAQCRQGRREIFVSFMPIADII